MFLASYAVHMAIPAPAKVDLVHAATFLDMVKETHE